MADISTLEDWDAGEQVTDTKLDNVIGSAVILPTFVTGKTELVTPLGTEFFNVVESGGGFKKVLLSNIPGAATQPNPTYSPLTDQATIIQTCVANKVYQNAKVTLGGNRLLQIDSKTNGMFGVIIVTQDGTGNRTLTLPASSYGLGHTGVITLADLDPTPGSSTICSWTYDGVNLYWTFARYDIVTSFARVFRNTTQTLTTATVTSILFDQETSDNDGMHSTVSNSERITITNPGIYLLNGTIIWATDSVGERYCDFALNAGLTVLAQHRHLATSGAELNLTTTISLAKDDYVVFRGYHTKGSNLGVAGANFSAVRIGPPL